MSTIEQDAPRKRGRQPGTMSEDHKKALVEGREQARIVSQYLEALDTYRPKRGRKRTKETIQARLESITAQVGEADPLTRLLLLQEQKDLQMELARSEEVPDLTELENRFVAIAADFSARRGISYAAWREFGLNPKTLKAAGINR